MNNNFLKKILYLTCIISMSFLPLKSMDESEFGKYKEKQTSDDVEQSNLTDTCLPNDNDEAEWLPDDIVSPTRWIQGEIDYPQGLFDDKHGIKVRQLYNPEQISTETPILFIVIHGTWGSESTSYFDDQDKKNQEFRSIKRTAAWYSTYNRKNLELLSYFWAGEWTDLGKRTAAKKLKKFLKHIDPEHIADTVILGHSHGCNVANCLSRNNRFKLKPIKLLIYFAGPIRKEEEYTPKHYEQLVYFYSDEDLVIKLARINEEEARKEGIMIGLIAFAGGGLLLGGLAAPKAISAYKGIKIAELAKSVTITSNIAAGAGGATLAGDAIYTYNKLNKLMKGDNFFKRKKGRIATGLSVKFNGKDRGWKKGHTHIIELAQFLPIILKKLHKQFPAHHATSSIFNLNVDTEEHYDDENSVHITIIDGGIISTMPEAFHYYANDENNEEKEETILEFKEGNLLITDSFNGKTFKNEVAFSEEEATRFIKKYRKSMNSYGN